MNDYYSKRIPRKPNEIKKTLTWFTQHYGSPDCIKYDDNNEPELSSIPYYVECFYAVRGAYPDKALKAAANDFINNVYKNDVFISFNEINLIICLHASIDRTNAIVELAKTYHTINSQYDYPNKFISMICHGLDTILRIIVIKVRMLVKPSVALLILLTVLMLYCQQVLSIALSL